MDGFGQDLRQAARTLARRPGLVVVAVVTIGFGIGAATAIFSVADAVVLRPLPFADPGRVVMLWQEDKARGERFIELGYPTFRDWRAQSRVFEELAGMPSTNQGWILSGRGEPVPVLGRWVTEPFFRLLGVSPVLGRVFRPEEDREGAPRVVVVGDALWRQRLGADPAVVGRTIVLDDEAFTVVGVMPAGFAYPKGAQLWTPLVRAAGPIAAMPGVWWMSGIGRLRPGVSLEQEIGRASCRER